MTNLRESTKEILHNRFTLTCEMHRVHGGHQTMNIVISLCSRNKAFHTWWVSVQVGSPDCSLSLPEGGRASERCSSYIAMETS